MSDNYQAVYDAVRSRFHGCDTSQAIESAIANAFSNGYVIPDVVRACMADVANEMTRPFVLLRPKVFPDGDHWCALYGDDLQSGVCGFGDTPAKAATQFDVEWLNQKIKVNAVSFTNSQAGINDSGFLRSLKNVDFDAIKKEEEEIILREFRHKGYSGKPIPQSATEEQIAAWNEGFNASGK